MDFIFDGIEVFFNVFYLKIGKVLFGDAFKEDPKSFPLWKRIVAGSIAVVIASAIGLAIWVGLALIFE